MKALTRLQADTESQRRKALRIDRIAELMATGNWHGAASVVELAREWQVSQSSVFRYSDIAATLVRRITAQGNTEVLRSLLIATVERIKAYAQKAGEEGDVRALQVALNAVELQARFHPDVLAPVRIEAVAREAWDALALPEKRARLQAAKDKIALLEKSLEGE